MELAPIAEREKGQRSYMRISKLKATFRLSESKASLLAICRA
jgi:hypothetical protein